jgi:alpha-N-arabinofuranosidase
VILPKGERVPLAMKSPNNVARQQSPMTPLDGDFTWRDDFKETKLASLWIMLRAPKEIWWKIGDGKLKLMPRTEQLSGRGNPSFLARRVQHADFVASTDVEIPGEPGVSAGLAVFQGERFNYFAGVRRATNGVTLFIERNKGRGGSGEVIESMNLPAAKNVQLRITANKAKCGFEYAPDNGAWKTLAAGLDATLLTTDVAGGFVGATVGLYARRDQNENK